jgi:hypothetical protein
MKTAWLATAIVLAAASVAHADRITIKVVEIAGGLAYIEPGSAAGLAPGTKIELGPVSRTVVDVTETTATIKLDGLVLVIGQTGSANVVPGQHAATAKRAEVHPPDAFRDQWPEASRPADVQEVAHVPLGAGARGGQAHVTVLGHAYASAQHGSHAAQGEARVIASFDVLEDRPLSADADVAVRAFSDGYTASARTPLFVRAAQLRYGDALDPRLALGRLRFAAATVGMLDGGRAMARFGTLEVAAFGGLVPDPISGKPDTGASRFGAEASYDAATSPWQPRIGLTAIGSTWSGQVDERRLALTASATHDRLILDGWAEAQQFPSGNPWGAHALELTGAGVSGEWHERGDHLGGDISFLRPERSLRLASVLPAEWLCTRAPQAGDVATEGCRGGDYWTTATMSAGLRRGRFVVDAIGSVGKTHAVTSSYTSSAYLRAELHIDRHRLVLGGSAGQAEFAAWTAGEAGIGSALTHSVDAEVRYRGELLDYAASTGASLLHAIIVDVRYLHSTTLDVGMSALGTTGPDRDALAVLATIAWRPLP